MLPYTIYPNSRAFGQSPPLHWTFLFLYFLFFIVYDLGADKRFSLLMLKPTRSSWSCCRRQKRWKQFAPIRDIDLQGVCWLG
ncbi:hypothetical protein BDZ91DRAFT_739125 [Kalaharituber pfeilii]|nr:hypothetical protein BDZ91DRAFT_739125 [Kalaharituber pfeilii]